MQRKGRGEGSRTRERKERGEVSPPKLFLRRTAPGCIQGLFESLLMSCARCNIGGGQNVQNKQRRGINSQRPGPSWRLAVTDIRPVHTAVLPPARRERAGNLATRLGPSPCATDRSRAEPRRRRLADQLQVARPRRRCDARAMYRFHSRHGPGFLLLFSPYSERPEVYVESVMSDETRAVVHGSILYFVFLQK